MTEPELFAAPNTSIGPTFLASFETRCPVCAHGVYPGDEAVMVDGEACHEGCADDY